jgi:hypothetical protein
VINKDYMVGDSVDFNRTSTVTLVPQPDPPDPEEPAPASNPPPPSSGPGEGPADPPLLPNTALPDPEPSWPLLAGAALLVATWTRLTFRRRPRSEAITRH